MKEQRREASLGYKVELLENIRLKQESLGHQDAKLRHRGVRPFAQGHTSGDEQSWDSDLRPCSNHQVTVSSGLAD